MTRGPKTIGQSLRDAIGLDASNQVTLTCRDCPTEVSISQWALDTIRKALAATRQGRMTRRDHPRCPECHRAWRERQRLAREEQEARAAERRKMDVERRSRERPRHGDYEP